MPCREFTAKDGDDPSVFALTRDPIFIFLDCDGIEANLNTKFVGLEKKVFENVAGNGRASLEEDAERKVMVDVGLADVKNRGIVFGENGSESRRYAGLVMTGNIDENQFDVVHKQQG